MNFKLTKKAIDEIPLTEVGQKIYRDSELIGFALRVTKVKTYIVERKLFSKTVRVTIGAHGVFTPTQAREEAQRILGDMARGINPNQAKQEKIDAQNIKSINPTLHDAYVAYIAERKLKPNTLRDYKFCVDDYFKEWRDKPLAEINRKNIQDMHKEISERSEARANMAMRFLRALFNFAIEHYLDNNDNPIIPNNPVKTLSAKRSWNIVESRTGHIQRHQIKPWFDAVNSFEDEYLATDSECKHTSRDYFLTLLFTGFRRHECACVEWSEIDLVNGTITSKDPKNGKRHTLPMGNYLWGIMKARKARATSKYVFPTEEGSGHLIDRRKVASKITSVSGVPFAPHDLRRTFCSIVESLSIGKYTMKKLMNHSMSGDVTALYAQISIDALRTAMQAVEDYILREAA
ncbi:MAG: integrase arm-type DNA-binding domain-containing protein [Agitococcus sp.]|nr:integrase arm-type DNA-binding domain-containing protein [Agitococcus sp.]